MTLSLKGLFVILSTSDTEHCATQHNKTAIIMSHYAECRVSFLGVPCVFMLNVVMLSVIMMSAIRLNIVAPLRCASALINYAKK
jgi:hypothetical protein